MPLMARVPEGDRMPRARAKVRARARIRVEAKPRGKVKEEKISNSRAPVRGSLDATAAVGRIMSGVVPNRTRSLMLQV